MDEQAMDRAHRLGQTRQVTVYRLITAHSIEERILKRAQQKHRIQTLVIQGENPEAGLVGSVGTGAEELSAQEVVSLLLDDEEVEENVMKKQSLEGQQPKKRRRTKLKNF